MATEREGRVGLCKCPKTHQMYGVRFERKNGTWYYDWAFKIRPESASREKYGETVIKGAIDMDEEYPGCPYCEAKGFIICSCGKLNCNNIDGTILTCEWCGEQGRLAGAYDGRGIKFGSDV